MDSSGQTYFGDEIPPEDEDRYRKAEDDLEAFRDRVHGEQSKVWSLDRKGAKEVEKRLIEQQIKDLKERLVIIESELRGMEV